MKPIYGVICIVAIFAVTVLIGLVFYTSEDFDGTGVEPLALVESDSELYETTEPYFEELNVIHVPVKEGLEQYLNIIRLHQADMLDFNEVLNALQFLLINYGLIQPSMEKGQFSIYDVGNMSRYQFITQRNKNNTEAVIIVLDLYGAAPYKAELIYRGPLLYWDIEREDQTLSIWEHDNTNLKISWRGIGVD